MELSSAWIGPELRRDLRAGEMLQHRGGRIELALGPARRARRRRLAEWLAEWLTQSRPSTDGDDWAALAESTWSPVRSRPRGLVALALAEDGGRLAQAVAKARDLEEAELGLWALRGTAFWTQAFWLVLERSRTPSGLGRALAAGLGPEGDGLEALDQGLRRRPEWSEALVDALARFAPEAAEPRLLDIVEGRHPCLRGQALGARLALENRAVQVLAKVGGGRSIGPLRRLSERAGWWAPLARPAQFAILEIESRSSERAAGQLALSPPETAGALSHAEPAGPEG
ncbi:MAG: hypothetical protein AAGJ19_03565 [Myxococcota bacterium]